MAFGGHGSHFSVYKALQLIRSSIVFPLVARSSHAPSWGSPLRAAAVVAGGAAGALEPGGELALGLGLSPAQPTAMQLQAFLEGPAHPQQP